MATETTLILFKPDAVSKGLTGTVLDRFLKKGFLVRGLKMMSLSDELLAEHYSHIADKPFFPGLKAFMQETPVIALALEGENVIAEVRDLLGPTDSTVAAQGTIRGDFGVDMQTNVCHASDGPDTAVAELKRFFGQGEIFSY
ncbi:MAG: nucleoside-diphosphate kinase [Verrucomicrobiota bacterium]